MVDGGHFSHSSDYGSKIEVNRIQGEKNWLLPETLKPSDWVEKPKVGVELTRGISGFRSFPGLLQLFSVHCVPVEQGNFRLRESRLFRKNRGDPFPSIRI